jgi:hypothetical protein
VFVSAAWLPAHPPASAGRHAGIAAVRRCRRRTRTPLRRSGLSAPSPSSPQVRSESRQMRLPASARTGAGRRGGPVTHADNGSVAAFGIRPARKPPAGNRHPPDSARPDPQAGPGRPRSRPEATSRTPTQLRQPEANSHPRRPRRRLTQTATASPPTRARPRNGASDLLPAEAPPDKGRKPEPPPAPRPAPSQHPQRARLPRPARQTSQAASTHPTPRHAQRARLPKGAGPFRITPLP